MLLFLLAEEIVGELPVQILTDEIANISTDSVEENTTQDFPPPPPPPLPKIAVFGPVYEQTLVQMPYKGNDQLSNASILHFSTGAAYDFARNFAQLNNETDVQLLTVLGNDTQGKDMMRELSDGFKVDVSGVEYNDKFGTANRVAIVDSEQSSKQGTQKSKESDDNDKPEEESANSTESEKQAERAQNRSAIYANGDIYERINYKYAYAHRMPFIGSKFIFLDGGVNENAIRYVLEHGGFKTFALYRGFEQGFKAAQFMPKIKVPKDAFLSYFATIDLAAAHTFASTMCAVSRTKDVHYQLCQDGINFLQFFASNYTQIEKRVPYAEYVAQFSDIAERHMKFLLTALRAQNVILKLPAGALYSIEGVGVIYSEHSCLSDKCRVSDYGADEAFLAGLMHAVFLKRPTEDAIEFAGMCEIAALKQATSFVPELSERYIARIEQSNFVSKRWISTYTVPETSESK